MTALPRRNYRDPLEALILAEAETCAGCRWRHVEKPGAEPDCVNPRSGREAALHRCKQYEEKSA